MITEERLAEIEAIASEAAIDPIGHDTAYLLDVAVPELVAEVRRLRKLLERASDRDPGAGLEELEHD